MKISIVSTLLALSLLSPIGTLAAGKVEFNRSENGTLYFDVPSGEKVSGSLPAEIHDTELLGRLEPSDGSIPYFLLAGRPCSDCLRDRALFMVRPAAANGPLTKPTSFTYPGKLLDPKKRELVFESRAFFGNCLKNRKEDLLVIFQKERVDRRDSLQASVFIAEPGKDRVVEILLESRLPRLNDTLQLVKRKTCREISGRNRMMQTKAFDIPTRFKRNEEQETDTEDKNEEKTSPSES
jgi:hypothetical protein